MRNYVTITIAVATAFFGHASFAQQVAMQEQEMVETPVEVITPELSALFASVCASEFVLSDKAQDACNADDMPRANKAGTVFRNNGIGAEFNALGRNLPQPG